MRRVVVEKDEKDELLGYGEEEREARALSDPRTADSIRRVKTRVQKFFMRK